MSSIFSRNGAYYIQFYRSTQTPPAKRFSLGTEDRKDAEQLQEKLDDLWAAGRFDPWTAGALPMGRPDLRPMDALEAFLESRRRHGRLKRTLDTYRSVIGLFFRRYKRERLSEIRSSDVEAYVWDLSVAVGTRASRDRNIRPFFKWAVKENLLATNPMAGLARPPQPQKIPRNVTARELDRICEALRADYQEKRDQNACRPGELLWLEQAFRFAFLTGLRASEIARLRWSHVDLPRRRLYLFRQKSGREEALPLSRRATALLKALANEFPVEGVEGGVGEAMAQSEMGTSQPTGYVFSSPGGSRSSGPCKKRSTASFAGRISRAFTYYRKAAGIQRPVTFHGLRHGFCTTLAEAGKSGPVIQAAARHRELSTAMQYVHLTGDYLRRQLDDAFGEDG